MTAERRLTIAVDARELAGRPTGVGRYLACLLDRWAVLPEASAHRFVLYAPVPLGPGVWPSEAAGRFTVRLVPGSAGTWWEQVRLPRAIAADGACDVLFAPAYSAPLRRVAPVVLTIHDLSFFARPEWFRPRERVRRQWLTRLSSRRARLILTVSEFSRREIGRFLQPGVGRVRAIPLGAFPPPLPAGPPVPREPAVLFVGSLFNRRRLPDVIAAFARLAARHSGARLDIVGDDRTFPPQPLAALASGTGVGDRIRLRSYVPDAELARLYAAASVFVFLSEYEGFGLPPLEALARGVPPLVLDTPVAREIYGQAARYVRPGDVEGAAQAMFELLTHERARQAVLAHAAATLSRYSWDEAARATLASLVEAAAP